MYSPNNPKISQHTRTQIWLQYSLNIKYNIISIGNITFKIEKDTGILCNDIFGGLNAYIIEEGEYPLDVIRND